MQQIARAETERKQREWDALPASEKAARTADWDLLNGYRFYAHVKWCHDVRDGYAYKYINDAKLDRAEVAIREIVDHAKRLNASINTDDVWQRALNSIKGHLNQRNTMDGFVEVCQHSMRELFKLSPSPVYSIAKP